MKVPRRRIPMTGRGHRTPDGEHGDVSESVISKHGPRLQMFDWCGRPALLCRAARRRSHQACRAVRRRWRAAASRGAAHPADPWPGRAGKHGQPAHPRRVEHGVGPAEDVHLCLLRHDPRRSREDAHDIGRIDGRAVGPSRHPYASPRRSAYRASWQPSPRIGRIPGVRAGLGRAPARCGRRRSIRPYRTAATRRRRMHGRPARSGRRRPHPVTVRVSGPDRTTACEKRQPCQFRTS